MASEIQRFEILVPLATAKATPQKSTIRLGARSVERIDIRIPPGPRGNMGFQLTSGGAQVIPPNPGTFITSDNEQMTWYLQNQIDSGAWQLTAYNTGKYDHTVYLTFFCNPPSDPYAPSIGNQAPLVGVQVT